MHPPKKRLVLDEKMRPVGVIIDYQDWQKIEKFLEQSHFFEQEQSDLSKFSGVIKLTQDPLEYQRQVLDEW